MSLKVLLVSYHAPPVLNAEAILVWKTIVELSRSVQLRVLTASIPRGVGIDQQMTYPSAVEVCRIPTGKPAQTILRKVTERLLGKIVDEQFLWAMLPSACKEKIECDVIYSRSQPGASHILAFSLQQQLRKPWIAQFSDPWANNPYHQHHSKLRMRFDRYWERKVVETAAVLIFPTAEIQAMYEASYSKELVMKKARILPHHYQPALYACEEENKQREDIRTGEDTVTISYFGDFYGARSPEPFLAGVRLLASAHPELIRKLRIHFYGNVENSMVPLLDTSPVHIERNKVSYRESLQLMKQTDCLLLVDAPSATGTNPFLASKLIDYMGAGKKILGITDLQGTAADLLRSHGHRVISPLDTLGISQALYACLTEPATSSEPPVDFTTENVVGRLVAIFEELHTAKRGAL